VDRGEVDDGRDGKDGVAGAGGEGHVDEHQSQGGAGSGSGCGDEKTAMLPVEVVAWAEAVDPAFVDPAS
jgi:hypothetical protein